MWPELGCGRWRRVIASPEAARMRRRAEMIGIWWHGQSEQVRAGAGHRHDAPPHARLTAQETR